MFSCSVMSDSLRPHGLQHTRLPCPSSSPKGCSNSCPLSWWCHSTISSSVVPFSAHLQSFPASGSFPMSQFFTSGKQPESSGSDLRYPSLVMRTRNKQFPLWIAAPNQGRTSSSVVINCPETSWHYLLSLVLTVQLAFVAIFFKFFGSGVASAGLLLLWKGPGNIYNSVQFSSVAQSCLTFFDPMYCSMPGFPVHY